MIRAHAHQPRHAAPRSIFARIAGAVAAEATALNGGRTPSAAQALTFAFLSIAGPAIAWVLIVFLFAAPQVRG